MRFGGLFAALALCACGPSRGGSGSDLPPPKKDISVSIDPAQVDLVAGATARFHATVTGTDDGAVSWSAPDGGSVDEAGVFTAPAMDGVFRVVAAAHADPAKTATGKAVVTAVRNPQVTVKIRPNPITMAPGEAVPVVADVTGPLDRTVTWSIQEGPRGGIIDLSLSPVRYVSPPGVEGVFHLIATSNADRTASDVATVTSSSNLRDGGGPVFATVHAYAIWWGDPDAFPSDEKSAVEAFLSTVNGSSYLAIADQYLRGAKAKVAFSGSFVDPATPPAGAAGSAELTTEICGQIAAHGSKPDPGGMYFVFTPSVPTGVTLCGWHSWTACDHTTVLYAFIPAPTNYAPCNQGHSLSCNDASGATQSVVNYVAHELMEAITDPFGNAWTGPGNEIGDKCNAVFDHCVSLGEASWQIQAEWSNAARACVQE